MAYIVALITGVSPTEQFAPGRSTLRVSAARHLLASLLRTERNKSLGDVGAEIGRGRSTVFHAIELMAVEREDPEVDAMCKFMGDRLFDKVSALAKEFEEGLLGVENDESIER